MSAHSPGPWQLRPDPDDAEAWIVIDSTHGYFQVCSVAPRFKSSEELANARLIASAPTLAARVQALEAVIGPELQRLISLADYHRKKGRDDEADDVAARAERLKRVLLASSQSEPEAKQS